MGRSCWLNVFKFRVWAITWDGWVGGTSSVWSGSVDSGVSGIDGSWYSWGSGIILSVSSSNRCRSKWCRVNSKLILTNSSSSWNTTSISSINSSNRNNRNSCISSINNSWWSNTSSSSIIFTNNNGFINNCISTLWLLSCTNSSTSVNCCSWSGDIGTSDCWNFTLFLYISSTNSTKYT